MGYRFIQIEDLGLYSPEELMLRNGLPVVAIFKNVCSSETSYGYYSVAYLDNGRHNMIHVSKRGKLCGTTQIDDFDVILKEDKCKELLCIAWDLFTSTTKLAGPDHLEGLRLNIFRDCSGDVTKGYGYHPETLFSFDSLSQLVEQLKVLKQNTQERYDNQVC